MQKSSSSESFANVRAFLGDATGLKEWEPSGVSAITVPTISVPTNSPPNPERTEAITDRAAGVLRSGGVVIYPTDTLYAIGVSALDGEAVRRVEELKRRSGQPISVALPAFTEAEEFAEIDDRARAFATGNLPGPYTLILPLKMSTSVLSPVICAGTGNVGIRVPDCRLSMDILRKAGVPVTATSANYHGVSPDGNIENLLSKFPDVDMIVFSGSLSGPASTIVSFSGENPEFERR